MAFRHDLDPVYELSPDLQTQCFPEDIALFSERGAVRLFDCGLFAAQAVLRYWQSLERLGGALAAYQLLEPVENLTSRLRKRRIWSNSPLILVA